MEEEMLVIQKNKTWKLVKRPESRKVIKVKWVYEQSSMQITPSTNIKLGLSLRVMLLFFMLNQLSQWCFT